ncbi:MAG: acyltransferase family protein, partial [Marmoricola sp.]|nr:acyltransferase family protein [Marmoricola sp.]
MGDAEIIPIGTRGKPGRGTGEAKPSSTSRDLAAKTAGRTAARPAQKRPANPAPTTADRPDADPAPGPVSGPVSRSVRPPDSRLTSGPTSGADPSPSTGQPSTPRTPPVEAPAARDRPTALPTRPPVTADHRHPQPGIPPLEWLSALTSASKELFGENWEPRLAEFLAFLRRRLTGDFTVDDYGFDEEITEQFLLAAMRPIAKKWFRIEVRGAENIPAEGGALVVSNHSGTVPV